MAANGPHPPFDIAPKAPLVKIVRNHPCLGVAHPPVFTPLNAGSNSIGHGISIGKLQFLQIQTELNFAETTEESSN